jgi:hypothetical protein
MMRDGASYNRNTVERVKVQAGSFVNESMPCKEMTLISSSDTIIEGTAKRSMDEDFCLDECSMRSAS